MDIDVIVERKSFDVELEIGNPVVEVKAPDHYNGPFEIFPSDEDQIIPVKEKMPVEDICVKGITDSLEITENGAYDVLTDKTVLVNVPTFGTLIDTIDVNDVNGVQTDIDMSWFDEYDYIMMVPDLTFSKRDWPYITEDSTTGGGYAPVMSSMGVQQSLFLGMTGSTLWGAWFRDQESRPQTYDPVSYLYWYLYYASNTMTGTIKIYGIKVTP